MLHFVTASLLILAVIGIRAALGRFMPARLMYALWLVVLIKLCIPTALLPIPAAADLLPADSFASAVTSDSFKESLVSQTTQSEPLLADPSGTAEPAPHPDTDPAIPDEPVKAARPAIPWKTVRLLGSAALALWFAVSGCICLVRLHTDRRELAREGILRVYVSPGAASPCLAGFPPAIYLTPDAAASASLPIILRHERTHFYHGDPLWNAARIVMLIVYWYNPFVWAAAILSKRDAEFACDEAVAALLDEESRKAYAHAIVGCHSRHPAVLALGSGPIEKRIRAICHPRQKLWIAGMLAVLLGLACLGCSLGGADSRPDLWYTEGQYLACDNGSHMIIIDQTGPVSMRPADENVSFEGLTSGDRIRVKIDLIAESYPGQTTVYKIEKLADGEIRDIDSVTLLSLCELGWLSADGDWAASFWQEGRYLATKNGGHMIVFNTSSAVSISAGMGVSFDNLNDGDLIRVVTNIILDTYPGQTTVLKLEKIEDGSRSDIDAATLEELTKLGWLDGFDPGRNPER